MGVQLLPATRTRREELEKMACRLFAGVQPYTYRSVRRYLFSLALGKCDNHRQAEAWADEAMAFIERRVRQYKAITIGDPEAEFDLGYREAVQ